MNEETFAIEFDAPVPAYFPGETVSGHICVVLRQPQPCRNITVQCLGQAQVEWMESTTSGRDRDNNYYHSTETYFSHKMSIYDFGDGKLDLEAGEYRFPFQFQLPPKLPSSFEGIHGSVRYLVKAKMDRPFAFDYSCHRPFTVNAIVDLNADAKALAPLRAEDSTHLCCWCCRSGPITVRVWLDHAGYVPGETVYFCGEVDNQSGKELTASKLRLVERSEYRAQGLVKIEDRIIQEYSKGNIKDSENEIWDHVPIVLPALPPSGLPECTLIETSYLLEFEVVPRTFSFNLVVPLELVIGTVPLQRNFGKFQQQNTDHRINPNDPDSAYVNLMGAGGFLPPFACERYPDLPPVFYEEGKFTGRIVDGSTDLDDQEGPSISFAPLYATYYCNNQTI